MFVDIARVPSNHLLADEIQFSNRGGIGNVKSRWIFQLYSSDSNLSHVTKLQFNLSFYLFMELKPLLNC